MKTAITCHYVVTFAVIAASLLAGPTAAQKNMKGNRERHSERERERELTKNSIKELRTYRGQHSQLCCTPGCTAAYPLESPEEELQQRCQRAFCRSCAYEFRMRRKLSYAEKSRKAVKNGNGDSGKTRVCNSPNVAPTKLRKESRKSHEE